MPDDPHRIGELRSIAYHRAVAERLDEDLLASARARVVAWAESTQRWHRHAERWRELLDGPRERLVEVLTDPSDDATELRSATPFAGALTPQERWALWREVERESARR